VRGELPTISKPMYETVHTGLPVTQHGIVSNQIVRRSSVPNIFDVAVRNGRTTAAAAHFWFSELYNRAPFDLVDDREVDDPTLLIQHGRFYTDDSYPDKDLFLAGATLVRKYTPDYVLIHPMGMDYLGDTFGSDTPEYRNHAIVQDIILANLIPEWHQRGYAVVVTGDHGSSSDHSHGGTTPDVRMVPLYLLPPSGGGRGNTGETVSQLQLAPTILSWMALPIPETMKAAPLAR
jgi:predicted AlkP superfamily pyrophosphatase or phosphodiesterase